MGYGSLNAAQPTAERQSVEARIEGELRAATAPFG